MPKLPSVQFECSSCHSVYGRATIRCPSCSSIYTLHQIASRDAWDKWVESKRTAMVLSAKTEEPIATVAQEYSAPQGDKTIALDEAEDFEGECIETGMESVDHVLGGGLFYHSMVLLGADPGTGKSTLALQMADACVRAGKRVLIAIGEEHPSIIKGRVKRLGLSSLMNGSLCRILPGKSWEDVKDCVLSHGPDVVFLDSLDRLHVQGFKGSDDAEKSFIVQESCSMAHADGSNRIVVAISHFNGGGEFKGFTANEHDVDTTLIMRYAPDANSTIRSLSCEGKNRLGETGIVRYLEMQKSGAEKQGLVSVDYVKATSGKDSSESMQQ